MLLALMLVTFAVFVGCTLDSVLVSIRDIIEVPLTNDVGKGAADGFPEV